MIFPQPLLLALCFLIPVLFIYVLKRSSLAIAWVAIITVLDIFNSQLYMNLSAVLIFGIAVLPYLWIKRNHWISHVELRWVATWLGLLALLGFYYGHISPWPDLTHLRTLKDLPGMRSILHFGRTLLEWAVVLFLVIELEKDPRTVFRAYTKALFFSSLVLAVSALAESLFQIDFYHFFTGGRDLLLPDRPRGFAYEPRGLSQNLAYALLMLPFVTLGRLKYLAIPLFLFIGFGFSFSYSGMLVLISGVCILLCLRLLMKNAFSLGSPKLWFSGALGLMLALSLTFKALPDDSKNYIATRFQYLSEGGFADKFEVFDAASINFFMHQPRHLILGTGPGLIYLPASEYIVERDKEIWGNKFEALPHMGLVLLVSNMGLVGLLLFMMPLVAAIKRKSREPDILLLIGVLFLGLYLIQIRYYFLFGAAVLLCRRSLDDKPLVYETKT
jgi:hypothetical protein